MAPVFWVVGSSFLLRRENIKSAKPFSWQAASKSISRTVNNAIAKRRHHQPCKILDQSSAMRNNNQPGVRGGDTGDRGEGGGGEGGGGEQPERGAARGLLALPEVVHIIIS